MGCGLTEVYPPENRALADAIARSGALLSEFEPGTRPWKANFPRRNRTIAGLARALVVVEAGRKSGALLTAAAALEEGREVMAVPGHDAAGRGRHERPAARRRCPRPQRRRVLASWSGAAVRSPAETADEPQQSCSEAPRASAIAARGPGAAGVARAVVGAGWRRLRGRALSSRSSARGAPAAIVESSAKAGRGHLV
jgi:predicted Rossmann fold nucleotide-binding protein DprA/Smf involved in DNA uptake